MPRYPSRWRPAAIAAIEARLAEAEALGLSGRELARHVSAGYPFGARKGHPYRIWLHECERLVRGVVLPFAWRARRRSRARLSGQLWLFDRARGLPG